MNPQCRKCGAKCCKYFCFQIDTPDSYEEFENIRWFLCHEGVRIHVDKGDWYIEISNRCKMLDGDGLCRIYADRPLICRGYDKENCDDTSSDYEYDAEFTTPRQIDRYARKTLGKRAFEKARAEARAERKQK